MTVVLGVIEGDTLLMCADTGTVFNGVLYQSDNKVVRWGSLYVATAGSGRVLSRFDRYLATTLPAKRKSPQTAFCELLGAFREITKKQDNDLEVLVGLPAYRSKPPEFRIIGPGGDVLGGLQCAAIGAGAVGALTAYKALLGYVQDGPTRVEHAVAACCWNVDLVTWQPGKVVFGYVGR